MKRSALIGSIGLLLLVGGCGGGGGSQVASSNVVFTKQVTATDTGATISDPGTGITIVAPSASLSTGASLTVEITDHQRTGVVGKGLGTNANGINLSVDPSTISAGGKLTVSIPFSGTFDPLRTFLLATDPSGTKSLPLPTSYDSTTHSVTATIDQGTAKFCSGSRSRLSGFWLSVAGIFGFSSAVPAHGDFYIYRYHSDGSGSFETPTASDNPQGKRIAIVLHGMANDQTNMLGIAHLLAHDINSYAGANPDDPAASKIYDQVWAYGYHWWAHIDDSGRQFASDLNAKFDSSVNISLYGHSMGGLVCRWALEKEGLGSRITNLTTLDTPHEGVPLGVVQLLVNTFANYNDIPVQGTIPGVEDLVTPLWDPFHSSFFAKLNGSASPYHSTANYFATAGTVYQGYLGPVGASVNFCYNGWGDYVVVHDGIVPEYSAFSNALNQNSDTYSSDPSHTIVWPLRHNEAVGDNGYKGGGCAPSNTSMNQCFVESQLKDFILASISVTVGGKYHRGHR